MSEELRDEVVAYDVTERELLHEGYVFSLMSETFDYNGVEIRREFVKHPGAVGVIAIDDDDRVMAIRQYRHPIRTVAWEAPAGLLDVVGEPLLGAAQRELAEEADLAASDWHILLDLATSSGGSDELVRIFLARGLNAAGAAFDRQAEEADIELRWVALDDVVRAARDGSIRNVILVAGALAAESARSRGWSGLRTADSLD